MFNVKSKLIASTNTTKIYEDCIHTCMLRIAAAYTMYTQRYYVHEEMCTQIFHFLSHVLCKKHGLKTHGKCEIMRRYNNEINPSCPVHLRKLY